MKPVNVISIILLIFLAGCSGKDDLRLLSKVYVDLKIIEEKSADSLQLKKNKNKIFKKYGITSEEFAKELKALEYDREKWEEFFVNTSVYLDTLQNRETRKSNKK